MNTSADEKLKEFDVIKTWCSKKYVLGGYPIIVVAPAVLLRQLSIEAYVLSNLCTVDNFSAKFAVDASSVLLDEYSIDDICQLGLEYGQSIFQERIQEAEIKDEAKLFYSDVEFVEVKDYCLLGRKEKEQFDELYRYIEKNTESNALRKRINVAGRIQYFDLE